MTPLTGQARAGAALAPAAWRLSARQNGVIAHRQLIDLGMTLEAIRHRLACGRLHRIHRGVYAVGRPQLTQEGRWMAAVLACGPRAALSHPSAGALWELREAKGNRIHVSVPIGQRHRPPGITVHARRESVFAGVTRHCGVPVTSPIRTLLDLACGASAAEVEYLVNRADTLDLIHPDELRLALQGLPGERGVSALRRVLDRRTFVLTDSALERRFFAIVRHQGLPLPLTRQRVSGFLVDFFWPALGLVVETDGLRYHRTPAQQARDRLRDQAHTVAGLETLRYTHAQVRYQPGYVGTTLKRVVERLVHDRRRLTS